VIVIIAGIFLGEKSRLLSEYLSERRESEFMSFRFGDVWFDRRVRNVKRRFARCGEVRWRRRAAHP